MMLRTQARTQARMHHTHARTLTIMALPVSLRSSSTRCWNQSEHPAIVTSFSFLFHGAVRPQKPQGLLGTGIKNV